MARIATGICCCILLAIPCSSWSRARRCDGKGPPPLRDDGDFLWTGCPNLSEKDQERIQAGNRLVSISCAIIRQALKHNVGVIIENPKTSRMWLTKPIKQILQHGEVVETHFCQYGVPWKKATRFFFANVSAPNLKLCCGARGVCSRTLGAHVHLNGRDPHGVFWTLRAQPYPAALCKALARHLAEQLVHR